MNQIKYVPFFFWKNKESATFLPSSYFTFSSGKGKSHVTFECRISNGFFLYRNCVSFWNLNMGIRFCVK